MRRQFFADSGDRDEEWYDLVFEPSECSIYILHRWKRMKLKPLGDEDSGNERIDLLTFLKSNRGTAAHSALTDVLSELFRDKQRG
jgi:hypothetical protein